MQTNVHIELYRPRPGLSRAAATVKLSFLRSEFYATTCPSQPAIQHFKEPGRCNLRFPTLFQVQALRSKANIQFNYALASYLMQGGTAIPLPTQVGSPLAA
jgi:hypothetical protein